jgi:hypothetical protein
MSWLSNTVNDLKNNPDSILNKYLSSGTVGEFSLETKSIMKFCIGVIIGGVVLMLFYKFFIQQKQK